jgi:hypothetical protein
MTRSGINAESKYSRVYALLERSCVRLGDELPDKEPSGEAAENRTGRAHNNTILKSDYFLTSYTLTLNNPINLMLGWRDFLFQSLPPSVSQVHIPQTHKPSTYCGNGEPRTRDEIRWSTKRGWFAWPENHNKVAKSNFHQKYEGGVHGAKGHDRSLWPNMLRDDWSTCFSQDTTTLSKHLKDQERYRKASGKITLFQQEVQLEELERALDAKTTKLKGLESKSATSTTIIHEWKVSQSETTELFQREEAEWRRKNNTHQELFQQAQKSNSPIDFIYAATAEIEATKLKRKLQELGLAILNDLVIRSKVIENQGLERAVES